MKYNKSEIMKKSHELYKASGLTRSEALRNAWAIAKIDNQLFALDMVNCQTAAQKEEVHKLYVERRNLNAKTEIQKLDKEAAEHKVFEDLGFVWNNKENVWMPKAA